MRVKQQFDVQLLKSAANFKAPKNATADIVE